MTSHFTAGDKARGGGWQGAPEPKADVLNVVVFKKKRFPPSPHPSLNLVLFFLCFSLILCSEVVVWFFYTLELKENSPKL